MVPYLLNFINIRIYTMKMNSNDSHGEIYREFTINILVHVALMIML